MPLLAGSHLNSDRTAAQVLYALSETFGKIDKRLEIGTDKSYEHLGTIRTITYAALDPLGFEGWRLATDGGGGEYCLWLLPPGYLPLSNVSDKSVTFRCATFDAYIRSGEYFPYTNCLAAYDDNMDSLSLAFYTSIHTASVSDNTLYMTDDGKSDYYKSVILVFLAKDQDGGTFGGGGINFVSSFFSENGQLSYVGYAPNTGYQYAYEPFIAKPNFNRRNMLYLVDMPNFNSDSLSAAKSMKAGITVPYIFEDESKFGMIYKIGNRRFINFRRHDTQSKCISLIDPWCPF